MKLQTVTDEALYIVPSRVYQMLNSSQQHTTSNASAVKLNVVEHKFTQPRHEKVCGGAPLIGIAASGWLQPTHRTAGSSAQLHPCSAGAWQSSSPLDSAAWVCFCDHRPPHPDSKLTSVKIGEIHHLRGHFPRPRPTALGSGPFEDTETEPSSREPPGLSLRKMSSFRSSPPSSYGSGMPFCFSI